MRSVVLVAYGTGVGTFMTQGIHAEVGHRPACGRQVHRVNVVRPPRGMTLCLRRLRRSPITRPEGAPYSVTVTSTSTVSSGPVLLTDPLTV